MKEKIKQALMEVLEIDDVEVDLPKRRENGDYSSNICLKMASKLKKSPNDIALEIKDKLHIDGVDKILVKSGFLNFYIKNDVLYQNLNSILENPDYGKNSFGQGKKINLEYVSANPTGTLHIGHARGASYGDSMARILKYCGYDVTREYYINDGGNQINNLEKSIKARYENLCGNDYEMPSDGYHGKEIIEIAERIYQKYGTNVDDEVIRSYGLEYLLKEIKNDLTNFRVEFDVWSSEKSLYNNGLVEKTLNYLKENNYTYIKDDALYLKTSEFFDTKDRVLVKSDQNNTYLLPDIAYHMDKYQRGYDKLIDVLGADHHGYIQRLKSSIKMMNEDPNKLDVKILQMVRLIKNNKEIKMSKRTGKTLTMKDLVNEVGVDATRYFFAMRSLDTQMDFDLDLAVKKSNDNPVYYVSYAHARICSILKDRKINHIENYQTLNSSYVLDLLFKLYQFEDVIIKSANNLEPHLITNYLYELATLFHSFYANEHVLTEDEVYTEERLNLIKAVACVIKKALELIGVEAPEKM